MRERPVLFPHPDIVGGFDLPDRAILSTADRQSSDNDSLAHVTKLDASRAQSYPVEVRPDAANTLSMMVMLATDSLSAKGCGLTPVMASQKPWTWTAY